MKRNVRRGFTLAEVLVTVTITAVLAAVVVPAVLNQEHKGDKAAVSSEVQAFGTAISQYAADNRAIPTSISSLIDTTGLTTWKGPYLSTAQTPATGGADYIGAGYGLKYNNAFGAASTCSPNNYIPVTIDTLNGKDITHVSVSDPTFVSFFEDYTGTTAAPSGAVSSGPVQFTLSADDSLTALHICQIAAKLG